MCRIVWTMTAALPPHRIVGPQICERAPARADAACPCGAGSTSRFLDQGLRPSVAEHAGW